MKLKFVAILIPFKFEIHRKLSEYQKLDFVISYEAFDVVLE